MSVSLQDQILEFILNAQREKVNELIDNWAVENSYTEALTLILGPVLKKIGNLWFKEKASLAQGYVAGKIAEDILLKAFEKGESKMALAESKGPVVIGNIEDDFHALGRKMVVTFLQAAGWQVYDLGNDAAPADFIDKVLEVNAGIIGVSAMMYTTAIGIKNLRHEIDNRQSVNKIQLAVGGAVFNLRPDLVDEVGGDGTAATAKDAPDLFDTLWQKYLQTREIPNDQ